MAYWYNYPMLSATSTVVVIDKDKQEVILGIRSDSSSTFPGFLSIPGGFVNALWRKKYIIPKKGASFKEKLAYALKVFSNSILGFKAPEFLRGETAEEAAVREIKEELNLITSPDRLNLYYVSSNPFTDDRGHIVNVCFWTEIEPHQAKEIKAGDDIQEIVRIPISEITKISFFDRTMAFNHNYLLRKAISDYLKRKGNV